MYELNEVKLIGYVGKNLATSDESKKAFAAFDLATTKRYTIKGKENEGQKSVTHWHKVACFGKLADIAKLLIRKGAHVLVCGSIENVEWKDKEGQIHTGYQILANKILLLDKKNETEAVETE